MGKDLLYWAKNLLNLSRKGLEKVEILLTKMEKMNIFLNHLKNIIENKTTNADHMINKFSKNEDLKNYMIK